ncbi:RES family NAD+ phosphorylase [Pseudomonas purpurea]|uniref:RES family NAD+ phosphorylase n=1 Tax=Pseudomonas purpurea TaxID=3136737 RepID=UPI003266E81F
MRAWRIAKARRAKDLSGMGAAIEGGRWNDVDVAAVYMGLTPAICALETFVHATRMPDYPVKITCFELPDEPELYLKPTPQSLPEGWDARPCDRPSMDFGTAWLNGLEQLGLMVPSVILPLELNLVVNPRHPAVSRIKVLEVYDFSYDPRMFDPRG